MSAPDLTDPETRERLLAEARVHARAPIGSRTRYDAENLLAALELIGDLEAREGRVRAELLRWRGTTVDLTDALEFAWERLRAIEEALEPPR